MIIMFASSSFPICSKQMSGTYLEKTWQRFQTKEIIDGFFSPLTISLII